MYKAGTKGRFGYLGPAEGQMALANFSNLSEFKNYLVDMFLEQTLSFKNILIKTINETTYLRNDYQNALNELENESKVFIDGKGRKGGINDKSIVSFDSKIIEENMTKKENNVKNKNSQRTFDDF